MAIVETQWTNDTCGCVMVYTWDTTADPTTRTHTFARCVWACGASKHTMDDAGFAVVLEENQRKNKAVDIVVTSQGVDFAKVAFSYDPADKNPVRTLTIDTGGLLDATKLLAAKTAVDLALGSGLVVVK